MPMSPAELESAVIELQDRQAIDDCLMSYSRGIDRHDRELLRSVYHDDAVDDHGMFVGSPDEFIDWAFGMHEASHLSHQHCIFNRTCDLDGDTAHVESYYMFVGMNQRGAPLAMSGGRYIDRFEKRDGRWAIAARVCVRDWAPLDEIPAELDQSQMTVAPLDDRTREMMRTGFQVAQDRSDPSYLRPLRIDPARVGTPAV
jgi:ketosteroid isomerase-like protein